MNQTDYRIRTIVLLASVWLLAGGIATANSDVDPKLLREDAIERNIEREVASRGRSVEIEAAVSSLTVSPSPDDRVRVSARLLFWSNVDEWMQQARDEFDVEIDEGADSIEIRVELPRRDERRRRRVSVHYEVTLNVEVPRSTPLEIENRYGEVKVDRVGGPATIRNTSGGIRIEGADGKVELESRYGGIVVRDMDGPLVVETSSGSVEARQIRGPARLGSTYGNITVESVSGPLEAEASSGGVTASDLKGHARITSSYANIEVDGVGGDLEATAKSGGVVARNVARNAELSSSYASVEAEHVGGDLIVHSSSGGARISDVKGSLELEGSYADAVIDQIGGPAEVSVNSGGVTASRIGGDLSIDCSYGTVRVREVDGDLTLSASSTGVQVSDIAGSVEIETSYSGVSVDGAGGAVEIRNQSGGVTVQGLRGAALSAEHSVETTYANIVFHWPEQAGLSFHLESTYGSIESGFPGKVDNSGSRQMFDGTAGSGEARVDLVAKSGSVHLRED